MNIFILKLKPIELIDTDSSLHSQETEEKIHAFAIL